jgi:hypothetical protein
LNKLYQKAKLFFSHGFERIDFMAAKQLKGAYLTYVAPVRAVGRACQALLPIRYVLCSVLRWSTGKHKAVCFKEQLGSLRG